MSIPFRPIARLLTRTLHPAPLVDSSSVETFLKRMGQLDQGLLITVNHYSAPDFQAWWFGIIISALVPANIHWVVTSGWRGPGTLNRFTHWLFPRGSRVLGFTPMPAMPPDPSDVEARASAVRQVMHYASHASPPVIGLAPEGGDHPGGVLGPLPEGSGRFMLLISRYCPQILPVGVWKAEDRINIKFGQPYHLEIPAGISAGERDHLVGDIVMQHIAMLLPERLHGVYTVNQ